ncbi:MAG: hypothetical protein V4555_05335 [Acidobacteriota bacterium]
MEILQCHRRIQMVAILSLSVFLPLSVRTQQTTNTNCTTVGNNTNCASSTNNNGDQQRSYEAGQQVGSALGTGLGIAIQNHSRNSWVKKYCAAHPGQNWRWTRNSDGRLLTSGHCPSDEEKGAIAANEFMARHKDFIKEPTNSTILVAYLDEHRLDPREEKSYEQAYKDLKKSGKLDLYAK